MSDTSAARFERRASHSKYRTLPNNIEHEGKKTLSPTTPIFVEDTTKRHTSHALEDSIQQISFLDGPDSKTSTSLIETNASSHRPISEGLHHLDRTARYKSAVVLSPSTSHKATSKYLRNPISPPSLVVQPAPPFMPSSGASPVRLFVASIGNPPPYHATRHSAGHVLLKRLQSYLSLPPLSKSKAYGSGHVSLGADVGVPQWTLWQSDSLMNVSGTNLLKAYKTFLSAGSGNHTQEESRDALIILHDEMETEPRRIKLRRGPTSPKGHNGIKSVQSSLQGAGLMEQLMKGNSKFLKVGIGIGRPHGKTRDKDDVSAWVLGKLGREETEGIEESVGELVEILQAEVARIGR